MANILVLDDLNSIYSILNDAFAKKGHRIIRSCSFKKAMAIIQENIFDIAIVALAVYDMNELEILKAFKNVSPGTEVIMTTESTMVYKTVEAMKMGAYNVVTKPVNVGELMLIINRAMEDKELASKVLALRTQVKDKYRFNDMVGNTPAMLSIFSLIEKVSQYDCTVLVTGETGTGKELVARDIHTKSLRSGRPFVPVNCAAIPEYIQESELFGYAKGAFTDAIGDKKGLLESAHGGTLFLDEIANASPATQARLLRFLESGEIRRIGKNKPSHVNVRLIAATSKDLLEAIKDKTFRKDLYYRINVVRIHLPPLRDRKDDIPILAQYFVLKHAVNEGKKAYNISQEALTLMMEYDWPGNVRELQNAIQYATAFTQNDDITPSSLPAYIMSGVRPVKNSHKSLREIKEAYILHVLEETSWNCRKAASILGLGRATLYRKMREYGFGMSVGDQ